MHIDNMPAALIQPRDIKKNLKKSFIQFLRSNPVFENILQIRLSCRFLSATRNVLFISQKISVLSNAFLPQFLDVKYFILSIP